MNNMYEIIKWSEVTNLIMQNFNICYTKESGKPDLFNIDGHIWTKVHCDSELDNIDIINLLENKQRFEGELYIITDESHLNDLGAFKVSSADINDFANQYSELYGGYFENTDILIFNFELKIVWCYHHSNFYEVIYFNNKTKYLDKLCFKDFEEYLKEKELKENRALIDSVVDDYDEALKELAKQ